MFNKIKSQKFIFTDQPTYSSNNTEGEENIACNEPEESSINGPFAVLSPLCEES